jgi:hypothetical protein
VKSWLWLRCHIIAVSSHQRSFYWISFTLFQIVMWFSVLFNCWCGGGDLFRVQMSKHSDLSISNKSLPRQVKFLICAGGIFFFYLYYGILQENVYVREKLKWRDLESSQNYKLFIVFFPYEIENFWCFRYVRTYGPKKEKFRYSLFAVFVQCVLALIISFVGKCVVHLLNKHTHTK